MIKQDQVITSNAYLLFYCHSEALLNHEACLQEIVASLKEREDSTQPEVGNTDKRERSPSSSSGGTPAKRAKLEALSLVVSLLESQGDGDVFTCSVCEYRAGSFEELSLHTQGLHPGADELFGGGFLV
jgi:hypothetical protein